MAAEAVHSGTCQGIGQQSYNVVTLADISTITSAGYSPLSIFDDNTNGLLNGGTVSVGVDYYIRVGFPPFGFEANNDLGDLTLFNFNINPWTTLSNPPILATQSGTPTNPGPVLQLNLGNFASQRNDPSTYDSTESYEIAPVIGSNGQIMPDAVDVKAFGFSQIFTGVLSIVAQGQTVPAATIPNQPPNKQVPMITEEDITVDPGVTANVTFGGAGYEQGSDEYDFPFKNNFDYEGSGTAILTGGDYAVNNLHGGSGTNFLQGGNAGVYVAADPSEVANTLTGGDGTSKSPSVNHLMAGAASATLIGGAFSTNTFTAGAMPANSTFIPTNYYLIAGAGSNTMTGGAGINNYFWQVGDGLLNITGSDPNNLPNTNQLLITEGDKGGETWTVTATPTGSLHIQGATKADGTLPLITASGLTTLTIDVPDVVSGKLDSKGNPVDSNGNPLPVPSGNTYKVGDLSSTGIQTVNLDLHEFTGSKAQANTVTVAGVDAPYRADQVAVAIDSAVANAEDVTMTKLEPKVDTHNLGPWYPCQGPLTRSSPATPILPIR